MKAAIRFRWVVLAVGALALAGTVRGEDKPASSGPASLNDAISLLSEEARQAMRENTALPRENPDIAAQTSGKVSRGDLLGALSRRIDRRAAVEGYVKWQLVSYDVTWHTLKPGQMLRLVDAMPALMPMRQLDRGTLNTLRRYQNRKAPPSIRQGINQRIEQYKNTQFRIEQLNQPALKYHEALIGNLPRKNAMKLFASLKSLELRYQAGDPDADKLKNSVINMCRGIKDDPQLSDAIGQELARRVNQLTRARATVVEELSMSMDGEVTVKTKTRQLGKNDVAKARAYVLGKDPPKKK